MYNFIFKTLPHTFFDPLWIIFREESLQSVMYKTRTEIKLSYERMACLGILESIVETEM
jgi:hypothetical protein